MAYVFETQKVATANFTGAGRTLSIPGVNGSETDANVIVNGIFLLLEFGGGEEWHGYDPRELVRTVKQDVTLVE